LLLAPTSRADPTSEGATTTLEGAPKAAQERQGGSYVAAGVAFGLAAAALGVGAVAGGISLSDAGTIESSCHAGLCPANQRGPASTAKTLGDVSTATLIVGGAAALTGVVLLVVLSRPAAPKSGATAAGVTWIAGVGPGQLTFGARF
jgi:hypothetical protein